MRGGRRPLSSSDWSPARARHLAHPRLRGRYARPWPRVTLTHVVPAAAQPSFASDAQVALSRASTAMISWPPVASSFVNLLLHGVEHSDVFHHGLCCIKQYKFFPRKNIYIYTVGKIIKKIHKKPIPI